MDRFPIGGCSGPFKEKKKKEREQKKKKMKGKKHSKNLGIWSNPKQSIPVHVALKFQMHNRRQLYIIIWQGLLPAWGQIL